MLGIWSLFSNLGPTNKLDHISNQVLGLFVKELVISIMRLDHQNLKKQQKAVCISTAGNLFFFKFNKLKVLVGSPSNDNTCKGTKSGILGVLWRDAKDPQV